MELFRLLGRIAIDNDGANNAIKGTSDLAESARGKISGAFEKIGSAAAKVGKVVAVGMGAAATAIGAVAKKALDSYADYEQLAGGVETLFGKAYGTVMKDASEAFRTAGLSANEYMETVTGFSAALIQGLGGDTEKAATIANRAITDMADNANKMGSDISTIQSAYQGFAKQNYTLLDNLKLGFGGTQAEMARLINESGVLGDTIEITAETVNTVSFDKIIEAIGVIQDRMGITGTTAKEASQTISGSISAMKSSWKNLITGLGDEEADLDGLMDNFVDSLLTASDNVLPRVQKIFRGISKAIGKLVPKISEKLPSLLKDFLPGLIEGAVALLNGLMDALPTLLDIITEQVPFILSQIGKAVIKSAPKLFKSVKLAFGTLWDFVFVDLFKTDYDFQGVLDSIFNSKAFETLKETFESVKETIKPLFDAFKKLGGAIFDNAKETSFFQMVFNDMSQRIKFWWEKLQKPMWDALTVVINWLADNWPKIAEKIGEVFKGVCTVLQTVWQNIGKPIFEIIKAEISRFVGLFKENMPRIKKFFQDAVAGIKDSWQNHLKPNLEAIGKFLNEKVKPAVEFVFNKIIKPIVVNVFGTIGRLWKNSLQPTLNGITDFLTGLFSGEWKKCFEGIKGIVNGAINGIVELLRGGINLLKDLLQPITDWINEKIVQPITNFFTGMWEKIKDIFESIKGFFSDLKFKMPDIKMPHFKVSPEGWKIGDLLKGTIPKLEVDWYAKAMNNPMIMDEPTAFGINSRGQVMAGGEAGSEVVSGTNTLMNMISDAVAAQNDALVAYLQRLIQMLADYFPQILESMDRDFVFADGTMAAYLAPAMDEELGKLKGRKDRGR